MATKDTTTVEEPAVDTVTEPAAEPADFWGAVRAEYGAWRATRLLIWQGVNAFAKGSPVPKSHPGIAGWIKDGGIEPAPEP